MGVHALTLTPLPLIITCTCIVLVQLYLGICNVLHISGSSLLIESTNSMIIICSLPGIEIFKPDNYG